MKTTPKCAACAHPKEKRLCVAGQGRHPEFCPTAAEGDGLTWVFHDDPAMREFARQASIQEAEGYAERDADPWVRLPCKPRLQETWEFARRMGYSRVGLAFCMGLRHEAALVARALEEHGLEVVSATCKVGAVPKEALGLRDDEKVHPGAHESMCNPAAQAALLNKAETELNILLGLCVGHDALFLKHAEAPCTVLAVKDRVLAHNPLAAVYTLDSYYDRLKG